jgi:hypothetical protein
MLQTPPRTVAPGAIFQLQLPSSPDYHVSPCTPVRSQSACNIQPTLVGTLRKETTRSGRLDGYASLLCLALCVIARWVSGDMRRY